MDVRHVAIEIEDLEGTLAFYEDVLGLEHSRDYTAGGTTNYYVRGDGPAEIQFRVVEDAPQPAGIDHIAIAVEDVDDAVDRVRDAENASVEREPRTLERVETRLAVVRDPAGYRLHLLAER